MRLMSEAAKRPPVSRSVIFLLTMKILAVHSEDDPDQGLWAGLHWDRIVDLGLGGARTYERWAARFACSVRPLDAFRSGFDDLRHVADLLARGTGRLVDRYDLDWWEIMSILLVEQLQRVILLQKFVQTLEPGDEVHVSRPGFHADVLRLLLGSRLQIFPVEKDAKRGLPHYWRVSTRLSRRQIVDIFWDKYDPGYQVRGRLLGGRRTSAQSAVLLPTAYVNVSRTGFEYAKTFPEERFLLVTTRRSGWVQKLPPNVAAAWLSSYASVRDRSSESRELQARWESLRRELTELPEFAALDRLGQLTSFTEKIRHGFEVRDAWRNVLDREPVQAVLCADDTNPYTRLPLLLARGRGLPNVGCHHGALDGRYFYKRSHADVIWAKGEMEKDYLVRVCGVPGDKVELAAPARPQIWAAADRSVGNGFRPYLVYFSEPSEVFGGRAEEFYRDVLPSLASLALAHGRRLIVKLHPAESEQERRRTLDTVLSAEQRRVSRVVSGPLAEELLTKTWFGVTVLSTMAMECAVRGIPCFLCKWLDFSHHGYIEQFIRYGVGIGLDSPGEIEKIPQYLQERAVAPGVRDDCWRPVAPGRLRELIDSSQKICTPAAS